MSICYVYVAYDIDNGLTKIGKAASISGRVKTYRYGKKRADGSRGLQLNVEMIARYRFDSETAAYGIEQSALDLLPPHRRVRGDWYSVGPYWATMAVRSVIGPN